jgi:hypothetical protein
VALPQHQNLLASSEALGDESNRPYIEEHDNGTRVDGHEADRNGKRRGNVWQHLSQYLDIVACKERRKRARLVGFRRYLVASLQHQNLLASSEALGEESNRPNIDEHGNGTRVDGHEADRNGKHRGNVWQHLSQCLDIVACIERAKLKRDMHTKRRKGIPTNSNRHLTNGRA